MAFPTITDLPSAPQRTQTPDAFATTADTFVAALPDLVTEVNAAGDYIDTKTISVGNDFQGNYSAGTTYTTGQSVLYTDGLFYLSLVDSNTGNTPSSSPSQWVQIAGAAGASGGTADFVATGSIGAGSLVALRSDGTVEAIAESSSTDPVVGNSAEWATVTPQNLVSVFDTTNERVVVVYRDQSTGYLYGVVGQVSGTSITFGVRTALHSANYIPMAAAYDANADRTVVWYKNNSVDDMLVLSASVSTSPSGDTISRDQFVTVSSSASSDSTTGAVYDSTNNKVVVVGEEGAGSKAWVITTSAGSISYGTPVNLNGTQYFEQLALGFDSTNGKVVAFGNFASNNQAYAVVGTVSGTSISWGSLVAVSSSTFSACNTAFDTNAGKFLFIYRDGGNSNYLYGVVGTVSGTSISFGTPAAIYSAGLNYPQISFDPDTNRFLIAYRPNTTLDGRAKFATISGTSFSLSSEVIFDADRYTVPAPNKSSLIYDTTANKFVASYQDIDSDGKSTVLATTSTNVSNWIGISVDAISDTATGSVNIIGGINEGQTGLTANTVIYAQPDGSLSSTASAYKIGRAIASDKVLITEGNA